MNEMKIDLKDAGIKENVLMKVCANDFILGTRSVPRARPSLYKVNI